MWRDWCGWGGVLFLLGYGCFALWRMWLAPMLRWLQTARKLRPVACWGVLSALAVITLFNPHVYLDTVVLVGSIGARQEGHLKWMFVLGAACASLVWFGLLGLRRSACAGMFCQASGMARSGWPDRA